MSYLRERFEQVSGPVFDDRVQSNQNGWVATNQQNVSENTRQMVDIVTANYAKKIARGDIINNGCTYGQSSFDCTGLSYMQSTGIQYPTSWTRFDGGCETLLRCSQVPPTSLTEELADVEGNCKVRAIAQMDRTPYAFGEDLGEIGETIRFLKRPMKSLSDLATTMRSVAHNRAKHNSVAVSKALADVWTTYRFAAMPLVLSMYDALWAFNEGVNKSRNRLERLTARGFDEASYRYSDENDRTAGNNTYTSSRTFEAELEGHASILYTVSNPAAAWRFNLGLRNKDIPLTLWQLVPLSFMVDRVLDISTSIQAAINIADPSLEILAASYRFKQLERGEFHTHTAVDNRGLYDIDIDGGTLKTESFIYDRSTWVPSVSDVKVSNVKERLTQDVTSIVDLAAIIIQRLA